MRIYRYTEFNSDPFGHGAEKRTAQISEILRDAGLAYEFLQKINTHKIYPSKIISKFISHLILILKMIEIKTFKNLKILLKFIVSSIKAKDLLLTKINNVDSILLWEYTRSNYFYLSFLSKKIDLKVIGIPHNIESLVPNQGSAISGLVAPVWFNEEIKYLSLCDMVFCISKEDTMFLNFFGINAFYLPYYPAREAETILLKIRERRQLKNNGIKRRKILMLGSADNQPTMIGMIDRIDFFRKIHSDEFELLIAGFNTEMLQVKQTEIPKIQLLGTLELIDLENILSIVDYILIHQPPTSGALTRIIEMLIAGIPVILNFPSARDYFNLDGINLYRDDETFLELLKSDIPKMPDLPLKPLDDYRFFIKKIETLIMK